MNFIVSANTDVGISRSNNQDSLSVKVINTPQGRMTFAIMCDGMGGLEKGEVASASVIHAFDNWVQNELSLLCHEPIQDSVIRSQWNKIIDEQNKAIANYGALHGTRMGTTAVIMLLTQNRYYIMNVGDSRAYEITDSAKQITEDQTLLAREVALGNMTEEEAKHDSRGNILLQCIGASEVVYPDMFFDDVKTDAVYMLCSDGFRHVITPEEIYEKLQPACLLDENTMNTQVRELIELNKQRLEKDNISVVTVRTF